MTPERKIIFQSENITLVLLEYGTDDVVVTFNELGAVINGDRFWGDVLFDKMEVTAIGFMTPKPNWYPIQETKEAVAAANRAINGRRVITYGHSQGGYGALKFSKALSASVALSFCPQWSIDPADVGTFDTQYARWHIPDLENGSKIEAPDLCPRNFIFFDPHHKVDSAHADNIISCGNVERVIVPFTSHRSVAIVSQGKIAGDLFNYVRQSDEISSAYLRNLIRRARSKSDNYKGEKASALLARAKYSTRFLDVVIQTFSGPLRTVMECRRHAYSGDLETASAILSGMTDAEFLQTEFLAFWAGFRALSFEAGELRIARLMRARYPGNSLACLHAVNSFIQYGKSDEAVAELSEIATFTDAKDHIGYFVHFITLLKRDDLNESLLFPLMEKAAETPADLLDVKFKIADILKWKQSRSKYFNYLMEMAPLCEDSPGHLMRLGGMFGEIGESGASAEIFRKLSKRNPGDLPLYLKYLAALAATDQFHCQMYLDAFISENQMTAELWWLLSFPRELIGKHFDAIKDVRAALRGGADPLECNRRLLYLYEVTGQGRRVRKLKSSMRPDKGPAFSWLFWRPKAAPLSP